MRQLGKKGVRLGVCVWLFLSYAFLLYAVFYGRTDAARWQREEAQGARITLALPSDGYVAATTQRASRILPQVFTAKEWWIASGEWARSLFFCVRPVGRGWGSVEFFSLLSHAAKAGPVLRL